MIVWVAGMIALAISAPLPAGIAKSFDPTNLTSPFHSAVLNRLLAPAGRYDTTWYIGIAQHGYASTQSHAFFPVYPMLIKLVDYVVDQPLVVGLVISLLCFGGAMVLLQRLAILEVGESAGNLTVWLVALFPLSLYFSAVYTEAIFMFLSVAAIYAARTERWLWAGVLAAIASATRSDGVILIVPIVWIYLWGPRPSLTRPAAGIRDAVAAAWSNRGWSILWLGLAPVGLIGYLIYCAASGGTFTEPFHAAAFYWGRASQGPFSEIWTAFGHAPHDLSVFFSSTAVGFLSWPGHWRTNNLVDILWLVPTVIGLIASWRYLPKVYVAYALLIILASTSNPSPLEPMMSYARYIMPAFPLFMGPAVWLSRRPAWQAGAIGVSGALLAFYSVLWALWGWVA